MAGIPNTLPSYMDSQGIYDLRADGQFKWMFQYAENSQAAEVFNRICPTVPSKTAVERFAGLMSIGKLERMRGKIGLKPVADFETTVTSYEYATGFSVSYRDRKLDQNNLQVFGSMPAALGAQAFLKRFELFSDLLEDNGTWGVDGLSIFNASHFFGNNAVGVTISSTSAPTESDGQKILDAALPAFGNFKTDRGTPLTEWPSFSNLLLIGPVRYGPMFRRLKAQTLIPTYFAAGAGSVRDNIDNEAFMYWPNPRLTQATNKIYAVLMDPAAGGISSAPPTVRTELQTYEYTETQPGSETEVIGKQKIATVYGDEGQGPMNVARLIEFTLST